MLAGIASSIVSRLRDVPARVEAQLNVRAGAATDPSLLPKEAAAAAWSQDFVRIEGRLDSLATKVDVADLRVAIGGVREEMRTTRWLASSEWALTSLS